MASNIVDGAAVENADTARPVPLPKNKKPIRKLSRHSWRPSWRSRQDPEAQDLDHSSSDGSQASYIKNFKKDIADRQQEVAGQKYRQNPSKRKDWAGWANATSKGLQKKYTPQQHLGPGSQKDPPAFEGSITYLTKTPTDASGTNPEKFQPQPLVLGDDTAIRKSLDQAQNLWDSTNRPEVDDPNQPSAIRWIHLPANNMEWVESVMSGVMATCRPVRDISLPQEVDWNQTAKHVFRPKFWDDRCRELHRNPIFSRQMEPFATHIDVRLVDHGSCPLQDNVNVLAAFMPYLHWESSIAARYMRYVAEDVKKKGLDLAPEEVEKGIETLSLDRDVCRDEIMLRKYLNRGSLHPRRTLDQYHYYDLEDTWKRDYDQVVERYAIEGHFNSDTYFEWEPPILMVDQCWVWAIGSDTVITAFPQTWDSYDRHEDPIDLYKTILTNIQMPIHNHYLDASSEFARFVIRVSAINALQPSKSSEEHDKFMIYFRRATGALRQEKTKQLNLLWQSLREEDNKEKLNEIFDVRKEYRMLEKAQDAIEELRMIVELLNSQDETMRMFAQAQRKFCMAETSRGQKSMRLKDRKGFKMLNRHSIKARRNLVDRLHEDAEELNSDIHQLLKLKQQQASISEAHFIRGLNEKASRQGTTVMIFTVVTILFLPLSTLAAIFGINSNDFGSGSMSLGIIFAIVFPISVACVVVSLLISFSPRIQKSLSKMIPELLKNVLGDEETRSGTDVQKEASGSSEGPNFGSPAGRGPRPAMTGLSNFSTIQDPDRRHFPTRSRRQKTRSTFATEGSVPLDSSPEQAMSILRRNHDRPNSYRRRRRYRRQNSRGLDAAGGSLDEAEVALYSLSSASDSLNDGSDTAEDRPARYDRTQQSDGLPSPRARRRGKQPM